MEQEFVQIRSIDSYVLAYMARDSYCVEIQAGLSKKLSLDRPMRTIIERNVEAEKNSEETP